MAKPRSPRNVPKSEKPFEKILVANRGEIAIRVIRALRQMGIGSVAVFSEADRTALHVALADEAVEIGPAESTASYLRIDRIIDAAKQTGCQAVHPGYGFLAENPEFSQGLKDAGIVFVGPSAHSISAMGDKVQARHLAVEAGVEPIPGTTDDPGVDRPADEIASELGYPVLIKAAAGGGGKGMRVVKSRDELRRAVNEARAEAESAFGNGRLFVEKYIEKPRHIEVQILADNDGEVIHLGERECSVQRRHQKVVEESPSVIVDDQTRARLGDSATKIAKAAGYTNAGTVEFVADDKGGFYFLEMNTRLQVEHPVTEMITGRDLVKEQIMIASGRPLSFGQEDVSFTGSAIECRIYAEDPERNFAPSLGTISTLRLPEGPGVRNDFAIYEGYTIPIYYDPLIGKLVVWGRDRDEAIRRTHAALSEFVLDGVRTTIGFHKWVMENEHFISGNYDTHFIENHFRPSADVEEDETELAAALAAAMKFEEDMKPRVTATASGPVSRWKLLGRRAMLRGGS